MSFQDRWSRWHDKLCDGGRPSSNNGWIYTAYAEKLGLETNSEELKKCQLLCRRSPAAPLPCHRSPDKAEPPMSRDEILGLYWLKLLSVHDLRKANWNFGPYPVPAFNLAGTLRALWRMKGADRNGLWKNGGEPHLFRFAFSVPVQDRAYLLRDSGLSVPWTYALFEQLSKIFSRTSLSSELIRWRKGERELKYGLLARYFGADHPFAKVELTEVR